MNDQVISIKSLLLRFKWRVVITQGLVVAEAVIDLLFPLLIGLAINDLLEQRFTGLFYLLLAGLAALVLGSLRRFYDTRVYSGIYKIIAVEMVDRETAAGSPLSRVSARANLLTEFVEFLENQLPSLLGSLIGLVGIVAIIATLSRPVLVGCLLLFGLVLVVYLVTGKLNFGLNKHYNDELENQVDALSSGDRNKVARHFTSLMAWNIKLSDLETWNFAIIWLGIIALMVYAPVTLIESGMLSYGLVFSVLMYVFQYIEALDILPFHIQQLIRLQEISRRLSGNDVSSDASS